GEIGSVAGRGLEPSTGSPPASGADLRPGAAMRGLSVHVALAHTRSAALVLALARPGLTVIDGGSERDALAPLPIGILDKFQVSSLKSHYGDESSDLRLETCLKRWGIRTLGALSALPSAALISR